MSEYITLREAAKLSGYHQDYLSQLIRSGRIPGRRLGKEWLVTRVTLAEYMNDKNKKSSAPGALKLPWWRRHRKLASTLVVLALLIGGTFLILNFESLRAVVAAGDFERATEVDRKQIVITGEEGKSQELVITSYALDESGNIEVSVTTE